MGLVPFSTIIEYLALDEIRAAEDKKRREQAKNNQPVPVRRSPRPRKISKARRR